LSVAKRKDELLFRLNDIRIGLPYAYWLVYDAVIIPLIAFGFLRLSPWCAVAFPFLAAAVFFDVIELLIKWRWRHGEFRVRA
jgi:hypothetical protein